MKLYSCEELFLFDVTRTDTARRGMPRMIPTNQAIPIEAKNHDCVRKNGLC